MATSQVSAQARGVIVVLEGKAWVLDSSGNRVLLKVGDEVQEGQALATVEAMKMENILRAEKKSVVKSVSAAPGDSLKVDDVILEFE